MSAGGGVRSREAVHGDVNLALVLAERHPGAEAGAWVLGRLRADVAALLPDAEKAAGQPAVERRKVGLSSVAFARRLLVHGAAPTRPPPGSAQAGRRRPGIPEHGVHRGEWR
ncbi:hypothetical protein [Streptomyces boncukensis]|uniref:Uncharacterized protein n=1 Tax=Streptomyces boncukensis TaxID=2711219 RepID=A0A6G4X0H6_9ACTN|nr:hypothetical protein [Streptomyces boncukensis]NGO70753.1 hypothetical protein [Streptomyces boncukensis]